MTINVKVGDQVKRGDTLVVMEAMKMENNIMANKDGQVKAIHVVFHFHGRRSYRTINWLICSNSL